MRNIRIAAAMMRSIVGDKAGNLERAETLVAEAAARSAELIVLPEACLSGYTVRESMAPLAEPVPGPLTGALVEMAGRHRISILAGLVEGSTQGPCYLTQVLAAPEGVVAAYRKTHLGPTEKNLFEPGESLGLVEHLGVRFGLQLCFEGHFPEISLAQALAGAEVILIPHASPREYPREKLDRWLRYLPARAYDNTVYIVACNAVGKNGGGLTFAGAAVIVGPKGDILAQEAGMSPGNIMADLKARPLGEIKTSRMGYFLPERKPGLYGRAD